MATRTKTQNGVTRGSMKGESRRTPATGSGASSCAGDCSASCTRLNAARPKYENKIIQANSIVLRKTRGRPLRGYRLSSGSNTAGLPLGRRTGGRVVVVGGTKHLQLAH